MRKNLVVLVFAFIGLGVFGQKALKVELNHVFRGEPFMYEEVFHDREDYYPAYISRLQYYLSGIQLSLSNGAAMNLEEVYVLASANVSEYHLVDSFDVTEDIDSISFDLGVDAATNHLDPTLYDDHHPLALQEPSMHWGWSAGYNFIAMEGYTSSNTKEDPTIKFDMHATGDDNYLTAVPRFAVETESNDSQILIKVIVDVEGFVIDLDLERVGFTHGVSSSHYAMLNNIEAGLVFNNKVMLEPFVADTTINEDSLNSILETGEKYSIVVNKINSTAPTIFYQLPSRLGQVHLILTDIQGRVILKDSKLPYEGNYFMNMELEAGLYILSFITNEGNHYTKRFTIE